MGKVESKGFRTYQSLRSALIWMCRMVSLQYSGGQLCWARPPGIGTGVMESLRASRIGYVHGL